MKSVIAVLSVLCAFLMFKVLSLESRLAANERNAAIGVLSAEIANNKIGAFAPYFSEDKDKFVRNWIDGTNMPQAIFSEEVLTEVRGKIERMRGDDASRAQYRSLMEVRPRY